MKLLARAPAAFAFAAAGALCRFSVRHHETRWQIVLFWVAAGIYEVVVMPARTKRGLLNGFALNAAASTVAILCMKVQIEGTLS